MHRSILKPTGGELHILECGESDNPCIKITIIHHVPNEDVSARTTLAITVKRGDLTDILTELKL